MVSLLMTCSGPSEQSCYILRMSTYVSEWHSSPQQNRYRINRGFNRILNAGDSWIRPISHVRCVPDEVIMVLTSNFSLHNYL